MVQVPAQGLIFSYGEMRRDPAVLRAVEDQLLAEQGYLCAYTGRRLDRENFHIEHLRPQKPPTGTGAFDLGHDTDYGNMVACWPEPNCASPAEFGAVKKANWPTPQEISSFLSPLHPRAGSAFRFEFNGEISVAYPADSAANTTLAKLHLTHKELVALRRNAIRGAITPNGKPLARPQLEKLLTVMSRDEADLAAGGEVQLRAFCFAIKPHVERLASAGAK